MKLIRENKFKKGVLAVAISAALTGCNLFDDDDDSSSSSSSTSQTTSFNVSLGNAPQTLASASFDWTNPLSAIVPQAYAATTGLDETNFKVVIVDENGNAVEVFELTADQVEESPAGSGNYIIEAPGVPQLNCVIAVNVDGELQVQAGESLAASNALFAPTTATDIDVDLESTVAYQQFLDSVQESGGFDQYDVDDPGQVAAVEQLVNNVQQQLEELDLEDYLGNNSLETILSGENIVDENDQAVDWETVVEQVVQEVIQEQIDDIQNATSTTIASLIQSGGLNWFDADVDTEFSQDNEPYIQDFRELEVERGTISATGVETFYEYDFEEDAWSEGETFDPDTEEADDDLVLTADGWVNSSDSFEVVEVDTEEGTVLIQDVLVNSVQSLVSTLQAIDLEGKNIEEFLDENADQEDLATFMDSDAVFSEGATGVKISVAEVNDTYYLWYEPGNDDGTCWDNETPLAADLGGNCERVWQNNSETAPTTLAQLVTDTASTVDNINASTTAIWFNNALVELVETTELNEETEETTTVRTAQFFLQDSASGAYSLFTPEDESTPEWSYQTPDGLAEGESLIHLPIPDELLDELDMDDDESVRVFAVHQGFVRQGSFIAAGSTEDDNGEWVFNATAAEDIVETFDSIYQDTFLVDCFYESGWDDDAFNGLGAPTEANTLKAFDAAVNDDECGGIDSDVTASVLTANTWYEESDEFTFNADGTGSVVVPEDDETYDFTWSINSTADDGIPNGTIETVTEITINEGTVDEQDITFTERYAPVGYNADAGNISLKIFSQNSAWYVEGSDIPEGTGEIWTASFTSTQEQAETTVAEEEIPLDGLFDEAQ